MGSMTPAVLSACLQFAEFRIYLQRDCCMKQITARNLTVTFLAKYNFTMLNAM